MSYKKITISILIAVVLLCGAFSFGFVSGRVLDTSKTKAVSLNAASIEEFPEAVLGQSSTPEELEELFKPFWQAWRLVHDQYVKQPVDNETLMRGAISGMLESLGDPHTSYFKPEEYQELSAALQGEESYEGIGAWVDPTGDYLMIISPMPGSPAERAGLRTNDKIIAIDGEDMTGLDGELVRQKVLGPAGTTVVITIAREGSEPFDVEIQREKITVPSIESRMLDENIAYVHLLIFSDDANKELKETIKNLLKKNPKGLILDLRNNGGGYLETSVDVISQFIDEGVIAYEEYGDGSRKPLEARKGGVAIDIPIVVLINEGSASASEIVAGAIQDLKRGPLVGAQSYGKGSVQAPNILTNDQGAVRITIAYWLTPNGRTIQGIGLTPDYLIPLTEEDVDASRDPQLDKAIELILAGQQ
jgi:carboxyl-terminal processing protease